VTKEGAKVGEWTMDYDAAIALAQKEQKPVLINFTGSDWCGWCKLMDEQVFSKKTWQDYALKNIVLVTIDFPSDKSIVPEKYAQRNDRLQTEYGVGGYPTYILLDSDAKTKIGQLGAGQEKTPESFIDEIKISLKTSPSGIKKYIAEHPDKAQAFESAIAKVKEHEAALENWINTRPQRNDENTKIYENFLANIKAAEAALAKF